MIMLMLCNEFVATNRRYLICMTHKRRFLPNISAKIGGIGISNAKKWFTLYKMVFSILSFRWYFVS